MDGRTPVRGDRENYFCRRDGYIFSWCYFLIMARFICLADFENLECDQWLTTLPSSYFPVGATLPVFLSTNHQFFYYHGHYKVCHSSQLFLCFVQLVPTCFFVLLLFHSVSNCGISSFYICKLCVK